jgi:hypothetical protein
MEHSTLEPGFDGWPEKMERRTDRVRRIRHFGLFGSDVIIGPDRVTDDHIKRNAEEARTYLQCNELF